MEKNILPEDAILTYDSSKNETVYKIGCFLHPTDVDELFEMIEEFVTNKTTKSKAFSLMFNESYCVKEQVKP